uniref:Uncharacterized protein n=1 Tax=Rhizophora mucronata TaxID=61149 RepID=A0A2P2Q4E5_RHIMU
MCCLYLFSSLSLSLFLVP